MCASCISFDSDLFHDGLDHEKNCRSTWPQSGDITEVDNRKDMSRPPDP